MAAAAPLFVAPRPRASGATKPARLADERHEYAAAAANVAVAVEWGAALENHRSPFSLNPNRAEFLLNGSEQTEGRAGVTPGAFISAHLSTVVPAPRPN